MTLKEVQRCARWFSGKRGVRAFERRREALLIDVVERDAPLGTRRVSSGPLSGSRRAFPDR
jgi:hypothetical protein